MRKRGFRPLINSKSPCYIRLIKKNLDKHLNFYLSALIKITFFNTAENAGNKKMKKRIGIIGVGHIAEYLVTGLIRSGNKFDFYFSDPFPERAHKLVNQFGGKVVAENQMVIDKADLIILSTRPGQVETALNSLRFHRKQTLFSVAVGLSLKFLSNFVQPATVIRVLPISCVAINLSPILIYPENKEARTLFSMVGNVHSLNAENDFEPATALVGAFYAWLFALMEEAAAWTSKQGFDPIFARTLVIETMNGACGMAAKQNNLSLNQIWQSLATPGGISEHGIRIINQHKGLKAWSEALGSVTRVLQSGQQGEFPQENLQRGIITP